MPDGTRWLVVPFALGFLLALAFLYATYDYDTPPSPRVNVRWAENVTPSQRESLATAYHLAEPAVEEGRTWSYAILDTSTENLQRLVLDPAVDDTHKIDRERFQLTEPVPAPPPVLFRFLVTSTLTGVIVLVLVVSLHAAWRRWSAVVIDPSSGALTPDVIAPLLGVVACAFLIPLFVHGYIGLSNRYMADDYCLAVEARRGIREVMGYWYANFSGSVFYTLLAVLAINLPPRVVQFWPVAALTAWLGLLVWAIWQLRLATRRRERLLASVVLAAMTLALTLDGRPYMLAQGGYWLLGGLRYLAPQLFLVSFAGCIAYAQRRARRQRDLWIARGLAGVLAGLAGLFSETHVAAQVTGLALATVGCASFVPRAPRRRVMPLLLAGLLGSVLALVITALAPGTLVRQEQFPDPSGLLNVGLMALSFTLEFLREAVVRAPWNLAMAAVIPAMVARLIDECTDGSQHGGDAPAGELTPWLLGLPVGIVLGLTACFAPAAWAVSGFPPVRTLVVPQFLLFSGLVTWSYLFGRWTRLHVRHGRTPVGIPGLVALALVTIWPLGESWDALALRGEADAHARTWDTFDRQLREAKVDGLTAVRLPAPQNLAGLDVVGPDVDFWVNGCVSLYYGVSVTGYPPPRVPSAADRRTMNMVDVDVGGLASITGYTLLDPYVAPGDVLDVRVEWLPLATTEVPHGVYIDLYDIHNEPIAQHVMPLYEGDYATTTWAPGRPFLATYGVEVPETADSTSDARLVVGLYRGPTLDRLPVMARGDPSGNSLGTVCIAESGCEP